MGRGGSAKTGREGSTLDTGTGGAVAVVVEVGFVFVGRAGKE
jgi:hypothetical protein